jgi:hypothetical protein
MARLADAMRGRFDLILAEAMDRISRDLEDIAGIFKRMSYADVKIVTLSEGEVTHLHVSLKGTMNAIFLKDLADKTRRGQRGRVEAGKSGGGNAYGYDVVKKLDARGEPIRGDRTINPQQAGVIRRIFRDYAAGKSAKAIAFALNQEGIPAPTGGDWGFSTINGNLMLITATEPMLRARSALRQELAVLKRRVRRLGQPGASLPTSKPVTENPAPLSL